MSIVLDGNGAITGLTATGISAVQQLPNPAVVTTLNAPSGVLATQNGMTGIAKAWAVFSGSAGTITSSFNISSVTRNATGQYTFSFTTAMPNTTYALAQSVPGAGLTMWINNPLTGSCQVYSKNYTNGFEDGIAAYQCIAFFNS